MQIELSKEQFENLLKLVYLGNWLANANRDGSSENPRKEEYEAIEEYIFSFAKQFGFGEYVDDEEAKKGKFYPTRMFEEETDIQELIDEYDEETFWDELIDRLGERDFVRYYGIEAINKMNREERFNKLYEFIDKWEEECEKHGVERVEIKRSEI